MTEQLAERVRGVSSHFRVPTTLVSVAGFGLILVLLGSRFEAMSGAASPTQPSSTDRPYRFTVASGISPQWTPEEAAQKTLDYIDRTERSVGHAVAVPKITSIQVVNGDAVADMTGGANSFAEYSVVWIVSAEGTFQPDFGLPGRTSLGSFGVIYFDDSGSIIGTTISLD